MRKNILILALFALVGLHLVYAQTTLEISEGYPVNNTYEFFCTPDFNATMFNWTFGDDITFDSDIGNVTHTYLSDGNYTVSCIAADESNTSESASLQLAVTFFAQNASMNDTNSSMNDTNTSMNDTNMTNPPNMTGNETNQTGNDTNPPGNMSGNASITIGDWYPQTGAFVFYCNVPGFTPTNYSWYFGDGSKSIGISNSNVFHTYLQNGQYDLSCTASDSAGNMMTANRTLAINDIPARNTCSVLQNTPAQCDGGSVVQQDLGKSCRTVICTGNGSERRVLACDKPSADNPLYLEMYRMDTQPSGLRICIAGTCLGNEGFVRSGLLVCTDDQVGNATNSTNQTNTTEFGSVMVMKHLCDPTIQTEADFTALSDGLPPVAGFANTVLNCPTTGLIGDMPVNNTVAAERTQFNFQVDDGTTQMLEDATYEQHQVCESDINVDVNNDGNISASTCLDTSHYTFMNTTKGMVTVTETLAPAGYRFGTLRFTPDEIEQNDDSNALINITNNTIHLNTSNDNDTTIMLHIYNFANLQNGSDNQTGNDTNTSNNMTNSTNMSTGSVSLMVAPSFPQGNDVVLICSASNMTASEYYWEFGDNTTQMSFVDNLFHSYPGTGSYFAMCSATDGNMTASGNTTVTIVNDTGNST